MTGTCHSPASLSEALRWRRAVPEATVLAGGTDLMVAANAGQVKPQIVLNLWNVSELRGIRLSEGKVTLGALTTYTDLMRSATVARACPALVEASRSIGAIQIQNRGTIGGNIVNASPAGDSLPVLAILDAEVVLASESGQRAVPFSEFYAGYRKTVLAPDELVIAVRFSPVEPGERILYRKVGTRQAQAISKVVMAARLKTDAGGRVERIAGAVGSVAPTVVRLYRAEQVLWGQRLETALIEQSVGLALSDITPIDDIRSTAAYRHRVAANLWRRFLEGA